MAMTPAIGASFEGLPPSPHPPPATSSKKMPTPCLVFHLSHTSLTALLFMHFEYFLQIDIGTVVVSLFNSTFFHCCRGSPCSSPQLFVPHIHSYSHLWSPSTQTVACCHSASPPLSFCSVMFLYLQIIKVSKKTPTF